MSAFTVAELLAHLDGRGLVVTNDKLIAEALEFFDVTLDTTLSAGEEDGIYGNPNPDYYTTVEGFDTIEAWAESVGLTLEEALDEGVCADDGNDNIYVPTGVMREVHDAR